VVERQTPPVWDRAAPQGLAGSNPAVRTETLATYVVVLTSRIARYCLTVTFNLRPVGQWFVRKPPCAHAAYQQLHPLRVGLAASRVHEVEVGQIAG